jgi:hypothetical protein
MLQNQELRTFQSRDLEVTNENTKAREPKSDKIVEWALIEIAIQLTGICSSLNQISMKTK